MINNIHGRDCVGKNHYDRNRLGTKMSCIVDRNRIPLSITFYRANYNDSLTTISSVNSMNCPIKKDRRTRTNILVCDKAYGSLPVRNELNERDINLVVPNKRNARIPRVFTLLLKKYKHYMIG